MKRYKVLIYTLVVIISVMLMYASASLYGGREVGYVEQIAGEQTN